MLFVIAQKLAAFVAQRHHINILVLLFVVKGENTVSIGILFKGVYDLFYGGN